MTDSTAASRGVNHADRADAASADANRVQTDPQPGPLDPLITNLAEIEEYLSNYLAAQKDGLKAAVRRAMIAMAAAISIGVLALAFLGGAMVLLLDGLAKAVAAAVGGQLWVGEIVVGGGAITVASIVAVVGTRNWLRAAGQAVRRKYEQRHSMQRARFGRDGAGRAVS